LLTEDESPQPTLGTAWEVQRLSTGAGGLLLLLPVLARLGYPEWLEAQPEWSRFYIPHRVLAGVLSRLRIPEDDPAWRLAQYRPATRPPPRRFVAPTRWRDGLSAGRGGLRTAECESTRTLWDPSGRLLLGAWCGPCPRNLLRDWRRAKEHVPGSNPDRTVLVTNAWVVAARRWLRRFAGIGLADLVMRPAALALTPTHADACFEIGQAELRIRRTGLDIDPGWVPWFGQVVAFRYLH